MADNKLISALNALQATPGGNGGGDVAPKGYKPLTVGQKNQWNGFLRFLYKEGYSGNKELDAGSDKTKALMDMYRKQDPSFTLMTTDVPNVQYEIRLLQQGKIPDESGAIVDVMKNPFGKAIPSSYYGKDVSKVDGRIGSLTSAEPFPTPYSKDLGKSWGTDYWSYLTDMANYMNRTGSHLAGTSKNNAAIKAMAANNKP